jgi:hypothetical protein
VTVKKIQKISTNTRVACFRVSEEEYIFICKKAGERRETFSEYVRRAALGRREQYKNALQKNINEIWIAVCQMNTKQTIDAASVHALQEKLAELCISIETTECAVLKSVPS